ncbi:DUF1272 domain-containing protein [Teredinibacter turnerae]|uniref:DUF1272 domain-containing protein n=1 Tax=Teredinibacter turnerae TaxID=2426 RepID=UPI0039B0958D
MISSYECTLCKSCVENVIENVCPNCGGGFVKDQFAPLLITRATIFLATILRPQL